MERTNLLSLDVAALTAYIASIDEKPFRARQLAHWVHQRGASDFEAMGCVVNGPGESKHANIGISLPGSGEAPVAPVFVDGERTVTLKGERIAEEFQAIVEDYVRRKYTRIPS